ncbi:uncharacterized protein LOC126736244 [Anthonomus grandis grandis]|uniref:uncharacterized protein LOC126736244 n=1 Tax=Anthonomus grandis grandis TaxID=2921223 RepID=UPI0021663E3F|nr:uncharacterized protein LOC126736244 [Anthonomus grandis grandis]
MTQSVLILICAFVVPSSAIWCYQCVSTQPGCGTPFNWLWHWTKVCPENDDVCVKIIEKRAGETVITRDCLSSMRAVRTDIPADHYEGCRPAAVDLKLGNYVNNSIKELDIYRKYYDNTTWCFCFLDHRCNGSKGLTYSTPLFVFSLLLTMFYS